MADTRYGLSARAHILGWMLLLVALALATLVLVTARVLLSEIASEARTELAHEASKFRAFAEQGDPASEKPFDDTATLLSSYLVHSVPNEGETYFSILDGSPAERSVGDPPARLDRSRGFVARAADADEPLWGTTPTEAGEAYYAVLPVRAGARATPGALVIVEFQHESRAQAESTIRLLALVGLGSWVLAAVIGWIIAGRVLAPIRVVRTTAEQINQSDLSRRIEVTGTGDVAELAETFNRMLDRVETAFASQREFLDDAGHELRTPITIIRGHLEVAGAEVAETERTRAIVTAELDRMARIVDDLMVLANAERPDFLVTGPVELAELVIETLAKVQPIASRHWTVAEVAEATTVADEQRLTQALTQLIANAVRHTDSGDTITLGSTVADGRVLLWVTDTGSGIPLEEQDAIFRRFARGNESPRGNGAGLGLAIVSTIAEAHGGTVRLDSTSGHGATFTLDLPFVPAGDDDHSGSERR